MSAASLVPPRASTLGGGHTVQHLSESDLLSMPPRVANPLSVIGRVESAGLGGPSFVMVDCADDRLPDALVLEYGGADAEQNRAVRVWIRANPRGLAPLYVLSGDSSSGGYITV